MPDNYDNCTNKPESVNDENLSKAAGGITSPKKFVKKTWNKLKGKSDDDEYAWYPCQRCAKSFTRRKIGLDFAGILLCDDCKAGRSSLINRLQEYNEEK